MFIDMYLKSVVLITTVMIVGSFGLMWALIKSSKNISSQPLKVYTVQGVKMNGDIVEIVNTDSLRDAKAIAEYRLSVDRLLVCDILLADEIIITIERKKEK